MLQYTVNEGCVYQPCFLIASSRPDEGSSTEARVLRIQSNDALDVKYGFDRYKEPVDRLGWLINMHPVSQALLLFLLISTKERK